MAFRLQHYRHTSAFICKTVWYLPTAVRCFESYGLKVPKETLITESTRDDELYTRRLNPLIFNCFFIFFIWIKD